MIKEEYKKDKKELAGVIEQIKIIRDSVAHNNFSIDEQGYHFSDGKKNFNLNYEQFVTFVHTVENEFYKEKVNNRKKVL